MIDVRGSDSQHAGIGHQFCPGPKPVYAHGDNGLVINECAVPKNMFQDFSYYDLIIIRTYCYDTFLPDDAGYAYFSFDRLS